MARSTLNTTGEGKPVTQKGHGTGALGPSDSTDSGSDIVGGPGLNREGGLPLQRGTTSDPDVDARADDSRPGYRRRGSRFGQRSLSAPASAAAAGRDSTEPVDETLTEHDPDESESMDVMDDSLTERDADTSSPTIDPEAEMEAIESIEKRPGINGAVKRRPA